VCGCQDAEAPLHGWRCVSDDTNQASRMRGLRGVTDVVIVRPDLYLWWTPYTSRTGL
jgi:hypothetical protein